MSGGAPVPEERARKLYRRAALIADAHAYGGALLVATGAALWSMPAGLVVFGGFLVYVGLFWGRSKS